MRSTSAALIALMVLTPAAAVAQSGCLMSAQVWSWKPLDRRTLIVEDTAHRQFKVALYAPCPGIDFNIGAAMITKGNSMLDCVRPGDMIVHRGFGMGNQCPIKSVELYSPPTQKADQPAAAADGR